jgi:hypothetical protein
MVNDKFELHVVLEGVNESSSNTFQARTSYLPHEILWGHRFEPMMLYRRDHNKYQVNFSAFHSTYEVDTPICSSYELDHYYKTAHYVPKFSTMMAQPPAPPSLAIVAPPTHTESFQFNPNATGSSSGTESGEDSQAAAGVP